MFGREEMRREEVRHEEMRRDEMFRMERRRRRRLVVGGMVVVGSTDAMVKMSAAQAAQIEQATGQPPEEMSHDELQSAMQQQGVPGQPLTAEDQQAMASAEASEP
jgi:hypothetical protein